MDILPLKSSVYRDLHKYTKCIISFNTNLESRESVGRNIKSWHLYIIEEIKKSSVVKYDPG